jgi:hypothetical protein
MSAAEEDLLFLLAKTLSRKEESKAVLCAFPALQPVRRGGRFISFFSSAAAKGFFFYSRKGAETQRGIESSPLRLSCFARFISFFSSAAAKGFFFYSRKGAEAQRGI